MLALNMGTCTLKFNSYLKRAPSKRQVHISKQQKNPKNEGLKVQMSDNSADGTCAACLVIKSSTRGLTELLKPTHTLLILFSSKTTLAQ